MADSISVAASLTGLTTVGGKLASALYTIGRVYDDVPTSMQEARKEMVSLVEIFTQLQQRLVSTDSKAPQRRLSMISARSLVNTLSEYMRLFSDLECMADKILLGEEDTIETILPKYTPAEKMMRNFKQYAWEMNVAIEKLQEPKITLILILRIINCQTMIEAEQSARLLETRMRDRMPEILFAPLRHHFDDTISNVSVHTSIGSCVTKWSVSDLSLAEIAHISMLELPIHMSDLHDGSHYTNTSSSVTRPLDRTPNEDLVRAVMVGDLQTIRNSLAWGADVDYPHGLAQMNPLQIAAASSRHYAVGLLLLRGAEINFRDTNGFTAAHHALASRSVAVLAELCKHNTLWLDQQFIVTAAQEGGPDVFELILKYVTQDEIMTGTGSKALLSAAQAKETDIVRLLLDYGADIHSKDDEGNTGLVLALKNKDEITATLFIERGAEIDKLALEDTTALHVAAAAGCSGVVRSLLSDLRASALDTDSSGCTPLHHAIASGDEATTRVLLEHTTENVNSCNFSGFSPMYYACRAGYTSIAQLLLSHGADPFERDTHVRNLLTAVFSTHHDIASLILQHKTTESFRDRQGLTVLHRAVLTNHVSIARNLLSTYKSLLEVKDTWLGATALHYAAGVGEEMTQLLLDNGASISAVSTKGGWTPLHFAAAYCPEAAQFLLSRGASLTASATNGDTPLAVAVTRESVVSASLLLAAGAEVDVLAVRSAKKLPTCQVKLLILGEWMGNGFGYSMMVVLMLFCSLFWIVAIVPQAVAKWGTYIPP